MIKRIINHHQLSLLPSSEPYRKYECQNFSYTTSHFPTAQLQPYGTNHIRYFSWNLCYYFSWRSRKTQYWPRVRALPHSIFKKSSSSIFYWLSSSFCFPVQSWTSVLLHFPIPLRPKYNVSYLFRIIRKQVFFLGKIEAEQSILLFLKYTSLHLYNVGKLNRGPVCFFRLQVVRVRFLDDYLCACSSVYFHLKAFVLIVCGERISCYV